MPQLSPEYFSLARSYQQEVLQELYESPDLLNEGLLSFEYPLYLASDEELDYFLGSIVRSVAKAAGGIAKSVGTVAKTIGKGVSAVEKIVPMSVLTSTLNWTPVGMAVRAGLGAVKAAAEGRNVFQGAVRSLARDPAMRFAIDTGLAAARGENILKAAQRAAQAGIGDLRQSLQFAAMVAPFIPGIGTGVGAALSAANALAAGQPISEALIAAARGAVPGGTIAQFAFDTAMNLAKGKNIGEALLSSARARLPGPAAQAAFDTAVALAKGRNLQDAAFAAAGRLLPPSPYAADALSFARKVASGQNIQQAALSTAGNAVLNRIQAIGGPPLAGLQERIPLLPKRLAGPAAFLIVPPWRQWPQVQRELSETNAGELGESRAAVVCPRPSRQTASGFPRHQSTVTSLPRAEQEKIRASAQLIVTSFQPGCQPILNVGLVGHADRDTQQGPAFEKRISEQRAVAVRQAIQRFINNPRIVSRINWQVIGAGAGSMVAQNPRVERERARNRRVEIFLGPIPLDGLIKGVTVDARGASIRFAGEAAPRAGEFSFDLYRDQPGPPVPLLPRTEWMRRGAMLGLAQRAFTNGQRAKLIVANDLVQSIEIYKA